MRGPSFPGRPGLQAGRGGRTTTAAPPSPPTAGLARRGSSTHVPLRPALAASPSSGAPSSPPPARPVGVTPLPAGAESPLPGSVLAERGVQATDALLAGADASAAPAPRPRVPSDLNSGRPAASSASSSASSASPQNAWFFSETGLTDWTTALGLRPGDVAIQDLLVGLSEEYDSDLLASALAGRGAELAGRAAQVTTALAGFAARVAGDAVAGELEARAPLRAGELKQTLIRLGPSFVKVGQILSTRPDLLPPAYLESLAELQDASPPFATPLALALIEQELGQPASAIFSTISPLPVAAASLGQVYKGVLASTGEAVAIKVQRPGVAAALAMDMLLLRRFAGAVDAGAPAVLGAIAPTAVLAQALVPLVDEFAARLFGEVDYEAEGRASEKFGALYVDVPRVRVPRVIWAHSSRRVLTLEWIDGVKLTDAAAMASAGLDVVDFVNVGVACTLRQLLGEGYFHAGEGGGEGERGRARRGEAASPAGGRRVGGVGAAAGRARARPQPRAGENPHTPLTLSSFSLFLADPHPGNLLATSAGDLVYLDFGMMSFSPPSARSECWKNGDERGMRREGRDMLSPI